jgi:hypothetical protein
LKEEEEEEEEEEQPVELIKVTIKILFLCHIFK